MHYAAAVPAILDANGFGSFSFPSHLRVTRCLEGGMQVRKLHYAYRNESLKVWLSVNSSVEV